MISLVMDTSNSYLAVGLFQDNMCLEAFQEKGSRRQSEKAIPTLKEVLDRHHIALKDVNEMIITLEDFAQLRAEYGDFELVGEIGCLGLDEKECDLCANIYALGQMADPIENVDLLVPTYIKDVEAKKACY